MSTTPSYATIPTEEMRQLQGCAAKTLAQRTKKLEQQFKRLHEALAAQQEAEGQLAQINAVLALRDSLKSDQGDLATEIEELRRRVAAGTVEIVKVRDRKTNKNRLMDTTTVELKDTSDGWHRRLSFGGYLTVRGFIRGLDPRMVEGHTLEAFNHEDGRLDWKFVADNSYDVTVHGKLIRVEGVQAKTPRRRAA